MARAKKSNGNDGPSVSLFHHDDASRLNIPDSTQTKPNVPPVKKPSYRYSPHLPPTLHFDANGKSDQLKGIVEKTIAGEKLTKDEANILRAMAEQGSQPWLEWADKQEHETKGQGQFRVDDVILHVHERVSAKAIVTAAQRDDVDDADLFARPRLHREEALQFYRHNVDWANRLILGDSLQIMSSLANRENLAGKVQLIYMDPPYGISYRSNWQNEIGQKDVKDGDEDLTREPEMIKAYRDTWTLGVHSYLSYLKQRLLIARELLTDSGSIFVQISDEHLHRVRAIMDEVFGPENFASVITIVKTAGQNTKLVASVCDYLIWFTKDLEKTKFRQIYRSKQTSADDLGHYKWIQLGTGERRGIAVAELKDLSKLPSGSEIYAPTSLISQGASKSDDGFFVYNGVKYHCGAGNHWKTNPIGRSTLAKSGRVHVAENSLRFVRKLSDFPVIPHTNFWDDTATGNFTESKVYAVQTASKIIERCILMTTDPGDLVLDPTCGSGTTASVAEKWGRRWITIDSSRVAISIARQRLLTASFESYKTKDPTAGVDPSAPQNPAYGFIYESVPHITLGSIAQNRNLDPIFAKYESILAAALEKLNRAIPVAAMNVDVRSILVAKLKAKFDADGARSITNADLRRWLLPGTDANLLSFGTAGQRGKWRETIPAGPGWQEWEVPFDKDPDWPMELQDALISYRQKLSAKMDEVNACVAANADKKYLVDKPEVVRGITRVSGPFSVEGVRPEELALGEDGKVFDPTCNDFDELGSSANADSYIDTMINLIRKDGVTFLGNRRAEFAALDKEAGKSFHARGRWKGRDEGTDSVAVVFGPQYGPINAPMTVDAITAAQGLKEITDIVIAGFSFDSAAQEKAKEMDTPACRVHLAHIRPDVSPGMQGLLKETPNSQLFTVFGQPDIKVLPAGDGEYKVEMNGVCVYNPLTGEISDSSNKKVAAWFLDADYDGRCFCFSQAFFPDKTAWEKISKALGSSIPESAFEAFTTSWPFKPGKYNRIAVKVIDPRGNEVMTIKTLNT